MQVAVSNRKVVSHASPYLDAEGDEYSEFYLAAELDCRCWLIQDKAVGLDTRPVCPAVQLISI
jgi:hypothetical protein